mmetsp:Transcript_20402/g.37132  ORF Transcript_20402/g.37132 Transcript_20402/m.37132 type:complete len:481 (+) Transcript_20402:71-1513(+)
MATRRSSVRMPKKQMDAIPEAPTVTQVGDHKVEQVLEATGLSVEEFNKAVQFFEKHVNEYILKGQNVCSKGVVGLTITDVDIVLRQLRLFPSRRLLRALFMEIDENCDNNIELSEFVMMVSKLRGRRSLSAEFYIGSLPRAVYERYNRVFELLDSNEDGKLEKEEVLIATRQLGIGQDMDTDQMKAIIEECPNQEKGLFTLNEFLPLLARLRKPPPEIDVALLSLTKEETRTYTEAFHDMKANLSGHLTSADVKTLASSLGFPTQVERVRSMMSDLGLDNPHASMQPRDFLFCLVSLGAGTEVQPRPLLLPNASYQEAIATGLSLNELWELGYDDVAELRRVGVTPQKLWKAGFAGASELRRGGYGAGELRKVGATAKQLKLAGFSLEELRQAGFSSEVLESMSGVLSKSNIDVVRSHEGWGLKLRPATSHEVHLTTGEPRWWATPRIKVMLDKEGLKEQRLIATRSSQRAKTAPTTYRT